VPAKACLEIITDKPGMRESVSELLNDAQTGNRR
jgi:hypothetical protein